MNKVHHLGVFFILLGICARTVQLQFKPNVAEQFAELRDSCALIPDLASASLSELSLLPGLGHTRAMCIIRNRHFLERPLTPDRIGLIDGGGEKSARELSVWYEAQRAPRETLKYGHEREQPNSCTN